MLATVVKKLFRKQKNTHVGKMRKVWKNDFVIGLFLLEVVYFPREVRKDFEMYFRKHPWYFCFPWGTLTVDFLMKSLILLEGKCCCAGRRKTNCLRLRESSILQKQRRKEKGGFLRCFPPWLCIIIVVVYFPQNNWRSLAFSYTTANIKDDQHSWSRNSFLPSNPTSP